MLYGLPLVALVAAVVMVQALQLGPLPALCGIGAVLALSLMIIARHGEAFERLLTASRAL